jgi:hypothetical protein
LKIFEKEFCQQHRAPKVFGKFGEEIALFLGNAFITERFTLFSKSLEELDQEEGKISALR